MRSSYQSYGANSNLRIRLFVIFIIIAIILPASALRAETVREIARRTLNLIRSEKSSESVRPSQDFQLQPIESPSERAMRVAFLRLCPRKLTLYAGEVFTLVPLPLDHNREIVQGVSLEWSAVNPEIASVSSCGEVTAIAPGVTVATAQAGIARAIVRIEVRSGPRPAQTDLEWDMEHGQDCSDPESSQLDNSSSSPILGSKSFENTEEGFSSDRAISRNTINASARPAVLRAAAFAKSPAVTVGKKIPRGKVFPLIDPDSSETFSAGAAQFNNAVGATRFGPQESSAVSATKTRRQLGSYNYLFTAPVLSLSGRGVGVDLALSYNSRLWNKDGSIMTFNFNKGWPAAGWTLGYGRIVKNYDNTAQGNATGTGIGNNPGNRLLIQPDGSRIHLQANYISAENQYEWDTTDGTFIHMNDHGRLRYPDGTNIQYSEPNGRLVPTSIKDKNGDSITIAYRTKDANFPYRWAIDFITDTLGRIIQFKYYGDAGYTADPTNGKPDDALAAILAPNFNGSGMRTLVQVEYQDITLNYNFGSMTVVSPGNGSILTVMKRIYYPQTGRGYVFSDYSSYGMARKISARKDMTGAGAAVTDGTEVAYTTYDYTTLATQVGALNDSPQYTQRGEWWQGKTDDNGNPDPTPSIYGYSRQTSAGTEKDTTTYPSGTAGQLTVVTTTDTNTGNVSQVEFKNGTTVLKKIVYTYTSPADGGTQIGTIEVFDEMGTPTKVEYGYDIYGRVKNVYEYGYKHNGAYKVRKRTRYDYSNLQAHLDEKLLRLVTEVRVYDGLLDNDNSNDLLKSDIIYSYDDYGVKSGMENYGLVSGSVPNHDFSYDQTFTARGNVTGVQIFSSVSAPLVSTTLHTKYDIFGNAIEADVTCCQVKTIKFEDDLGNAPTYYSQPMSEISGKDGIVPFLKTKYQYDFNTGLVTSQTDPTNLTTTYGYDAAWRLLTVNAPSGAVTTTQFDRDGNGNDQLAYSEKVSYTENGTNKVILTKTWFDGGGRELRSGSGAGTAPTSFNVVATVYDKQARVLKQSNPYSADAFGNGTPLYWTITSYDLLSRETQVKLPDNQGIITSYTPAALPTGATVLVTDQVGRKRQSETDGLGRTVKVTEQDPATGSLSWATSYSYDVLNNLTGINQNNQTRTFVYDALSRMTSQTTPEAGTVTIAYTDSGAVKKQTDARSIETHYKYDALNRPTQVWHTGAGGDDAGSVRPALPAAVAATGDVLLSYNNFSASQAGNGQASQLTDAAGTESYSYDTLSRLASKTRIIDGRSYQTQYLYNTADQVTTLIYPSGKRVRTNHDQLGRMSGLDRVDTAGTVLSQYVTSIGYNTANQITSVGLANGVTESYGYSADRLQMNSQSATKGASTLLSLIYGHSASAGQMGSGSIAGNNGQMISVTGTVNGANRNQVFGYDNVGRLLTATGPSWQRRYGYDRWGNRTGVWNATSGGTQIQSVAIAMTASVTNNRVANVNGINYSHDASGNMISDGAHSYSYDGEGRMASVDSGATASYTYDASNWRVKKVSAGVTTHCVWEGGAVIAEYNGATGALINEYIYAGSRMLARDQAGVLRYYHKDKLSTRLITDGSGLVVGQMDQEPFGEDPSTGSGESEKHKFTSYERDSESQTDYAVNRQYQTGTGRFMRPDPIAGSISNPQTMNRYAYVANDPVNGVDPFGLFSICFFGIKELDVRDADGEFIGTREVLVPEGCIEIPELGSIFLGVGDRGAIRVSRKKGLPNKDCRSLLRKIYDRAVELYNRRLDFIKDKSNLVIPGNKDSKGGTFGGHIKQFEEKQENLNGMLQDYNKGRCNGRGGTPNESELLYYARLMIELPLDLPKPIFGPDRPVIPSPQRPPQYPPIIPVIPVNPVPVPIPFPGPGPIPIPVPIVP